MAEITVRYFAAAAEAAGVESETWRAPDSATLDSLRHMLRATYGQDMDRVLRGGSFLVNGTVRRDAGPLGNASRIDVLPPFAGG